MSSQQGWIALNRKIVENPMWLSEPFSRSHAWIDLILLANHKPNFFFIRDIKIDVKRGELARGENALAERWGWSRNKVRNFLKLLEKEQQIILKKSKVINRIEIVNYDKYQDRNNSKYNSKTTEGTTEGQQKVQQKNINNNVNNINNENNDNNDSNLGEAVTTEKSSAVQIRGIKPPAPPLQEMIDSWNDNIQKIIKPDSRGVMLTNGRKTKLAKRFKDEFNSDFEQWEMYLNKISQSNFLMGDNNRNWSIDIDWALEPKNLIKIVESNYDNKNNTKQQSVHNMANSIAGF